MKNKKMWKMSISLLMVLCLMWAAIGQYLPSGTVKAADPVKYTVELDNAGNVFLCNKIPTDGPVTITYTVESATHTYTRDGAIVTTDPTSAFPYNGTLGSMNFENAFYLLNEGHEHSVTISKDENGIATGSMKVIGMWGDAPWSGGLHEGAGNAEAQYFGIWFSSIDGTGTGKATLTNVTCVETETGKDLGLQTYSANCVVTGGETPVGSTEYTVELNDAGNVFLCNKIPTEGSVTITYTVESATHTYTRDGAIVTTDPTSAFPYNGTLGSMNFENAFYLLNEGHEHSVTISKDENGIATGSMKVIGMWGDAPWSGGLHEGAGNAEAQYFGIWFSSIDGTGTGKATLTNVTCVETETGKDLGLQTNSAACNIYANHGTLKGATVSLGDDIGVNFYMELSNNILADENAYVEFTLPDINNTVETVMVKDAVKGTYEDKVYSVFTCNIAAKEMASDIRLKVFNGNDVAGKEYTYQVKTYGDKILADTAGAYTAEEKDMVKAMLNYGAYAQAHFGYNAENPANAGMDDADKVLAEVELGDTYQYTLTGSCTGLTYYGTSLMTTSKTAIRHYFELAEDANIDDFAFWYSGNTLTTKQKGTLYYVEIPGIVASKLGEMYDLTVTKGSETMTLTYSPYTNVKGILEGETAYTDNSKNMMRALYWYGCAAATLNN